MSDIFKRLKAILVLTAIMWVVFVITEYLGFKSLFQYGIRPKETMGLIGIICAPFMHADIFHITGNSFFFVVLGFTLAVVYKKDFWDVMICITVLAGLGTWGTGSAGIPHIGASGVIYGLAGFLIAAGIISKRIIPLLASIIISVQYFWVIIYGLIPSKDGVSYSSHWSGFVAGFFLAWLFKSSFAKKAS